MAMRDGNFSQNPSSSDMLWLVKRERDRGMSPWCAASGKRARVWGLFWGFGEIQGKKKNPSGK